MTGITRPRWEGFVRASGLPLSIIWQKCGRIRISLGRIVCIWYRYEPWNPLSFQIEAPTTALYNNWLDRIEMAIFLAPGGTSGFAPWVSLVGKLGEGPTWTQCFLLFHVLSSHSSIHSRVMLFPCNRVRTMNANLMNWAIFPISWNRKSGYEIHSIEPAGSNAPYPLELKTWITEGFDLSIYPCWTSVASWYLAIPLNPLD